LKRTVVKDCLTTELLSDAYKLIGVAALGCTVLLSQKLELDMNNTWPGGYRHAMSQSEHERWNSSNYPGTLQICSVCGEATERCEEDTIWSDDDQPLCVRCYVPADEVGQG
jgi:hypothetical protein